MTLRVATALLDSAFDEAVLRRLGRADSGATIARRCVDLVEIRTATTARIVDVALLDARLAGLDRDVITELHANAVRVVVVAEADERSGNLGADAVIPPDVAAVVLALRGGVAVASPRHSRPDGPPQGKVIAVWGPIGSPGRTSVAVGLADEAARLGVSTLLIDADTYGPSIAHRLGLLTDSSGLTAACRFAGQGRLDEAALHRVSLRLPSGLVVLTGLSRSSGWDSVRPAALDTTLDATRTLYDVTVVDVGFCLEHDALSWFEPGTASRNQAAVAVLGAADVVLAVTDCDAMSLVRLVHALPDVQALAPTADVQVVVNRLPRSLGLRREVEQVIAEHLQRAPVAELPIDQESMSTAVGTGRTLAEVAPRSPLRQQVRSLASSLTGIAISGKRRRAA
jgi:MinD-like ATPase involved in chromosome partitioning or flagellar assembly